MRSSSRAQFGAPPHLPLELMTHTQVVKKCKSAAGQDTHRSCHNGSFLLEMDTKRKLDDKVNLLRVRIDETPRAASSEMHPAEKMEANLFFTLLLDEIAQREIFLKKMMTSIMTS